MRRELGRELDDPPPEFRNTTPDVVGDELNFSFICERSSKISSFVGLIGRGSVKLPGRTKSLLLLAC